MREDLKEELAQLATASRHVAESRAGVRELILVIRTMRTCGRDTTDAYALLRMLRETVRVMRIHRALVRGFMVAIKKVD